MNVEQVTEEEYISLSIVKLMDCFVGNQRSRGDSLALKEPFNLINCISIRLGKGLLTEHNLQNLLTFSTVKSSMLNCTSKGG